MYKGLTVTIQGSSDEALVEWIYSRYFITLTVDKLEQGRRLTEWLFFEVREI